MGKVNQSDIISFLNSKSLALLGFSRSGKKFGNTIYEELVKNGYNVYPLHNEVDEINGIKCYKDFTDLPEQIDSALFVIPPEKNQDVLVRAKDYGIKKIWFQQGASDKRVLDYCSENSITAIYGLCILMFLSPKAFPHSLHKWFLNLFGKLPN